MISIVHSVFTVNRHGRYMYLPIITNHNVFQFELHLLQFISTPPPPFFLIVNFFSKFIFWGAVTVLICTESFVLHCMGWVVVAFSRQIHQSP